MVAMSVVNATSCDPERELLLRVLGAVSAHRFPGVDGMTIDDALRCYDTLAARGCVPGREELRIEFPAESGADETGGFCM